MNGEQGLFAAGHRLHALLVGILGVAAAGGDARVGALLVMNRSLMLSITSSSSCWRSFISTWLTAVLGRRRRLAHRKFCRSHRPCGIEQVAR